ncbi:hypothetical protein CK203_073546 [Vitis vinifera]|uniref:Uncharacterized protein n=1 Tax=Vitis vinifera TaxID=29760 RepID=A0A438DTZ9_VITVI|nr:hypothetical protein CK203_073546 [Vitis vinifera]
MKRLREENKELWAQMSTEASLKVACQKQSDKGTSSTWASRKKRRCRGSHLFNAMRARLGPQTLGMEVKPCMSKTPRARLGHPVAVTTFG